MNHLARRRGQELETIHRKRIDGQRWRVVRVRDGVVLATAGSADAAQRTAETFARTGCAVRVVDARKIQP